jgi:hypothetical protein
MNGLLNLVIQKGGVDRVFVENHTVGCEKLIEIVRAYPPERVRDITGIAAEKLREAANILAAAPTLVSVVLQGVYQSNQAGAAACQVNNLNLIRGMIGKPGCGIFQMNGQPTSQNTRECGCDGEFPFGLNPMNAAHVAELARRWNVDPLTIPHWHTHAHALEIFRHAETGSIKLLWIMATNPAVSLPELHRIRKVLRTKGLFVVVQDAFMTETAKLADLVLPAAIWGEKTGTFTNADRTVHISHKAVDPPGEARPDLDILLDFARRMDFRDKDGSRALYATDGPNYRQAPIGVVIPRSKDDVVRTVALARQYGAPVLSRGGGTSLRGQCCNVAVVMDFTKYLHHVLHIDSGRRLGTVEPGCVLDTFREAAKKHNLDAAALLIPIVGFLPIDHPRVKSTVEKIAELLTLDGFVYRFDPLQSPGIQKQQMPLGQFEGAFLPCTFWLATVYAKMGRTQEAENILRRAESLAGSVGLFAEGVDPRSGDFLGNSPLLFSQIEYVRAVLELARAR